LTLGVVDHYRNLGIGLLPLPHYLRFAVYPL
jgi:hypothetical protein